MRWQAKERPVETERSVDAKQAPVSNPSTDASARVVSVSSPICSSWPARSMFHADPMVTKALPVVVNSPPAHGVSLLPRWLRQAPRPF
eukprot:6678537-Pyramimonas_sp.AAC.1